MARSADQQEIIQHIDCSMTAAARMHVSQGQAYLLLDTVLNLGELSLEHEVPEAHFLQLSILHGFMLSVVRQHLVGYGSPRLAVLCSLGHLCQEVVECAAKLLTLLQLVL